MKKRLIEYNLPLPDISEESAREKNIRHGHPSTLHIWWACWPLASSRVTAFATLIHGQSRYLGAARAVLRNGNFRVLPAGELR